MCACAFLGINRERGLGLHNHPKPWTGIGLTVVAVVVLEAVTPACDTAIVGLHVSADAHARAELIIFAD